MIKFIEEATEGLKLVFIVLEEEGEVKGLQQDTWPINTLASGSMRRRARSEECLRPYCLDFGSLLEEIILFSLS